MSSTLCAIKFPALWDVVRKVCVMFHGNAAVERGFSVNKALMVPNLQNDSLIAQRLVYDMVRQSGGVLNVPLTKDLLNSVKLASSRRKLKLTMNAETESKKLEASRKRKEINSQLKEVEDKRRKFLDDASALNQELDSLRKQLDGD